MFKNKYHMSFNSTTNLFKRLGYSRFFGPDLVRCLDEKSLPPKVLIFVRDENRIPNQEWDFCLLYDISEINHLDSGFCEIFSKVKLFRLLDKEAFLIKEISRTSEFQLYIVTECFMCPEELLGLEKINFN